MNKKLRLLFLSLLAVLTSVSSFAGDKFTLMLDNGATQSTSGYFTVVSGGGYNAKYTGTYDGHTYSKGLKINSSSSISFTTGATSTIIIVQSTTANGGNQFKLNGVLVDNSEAVENTTDKVKVYTLTDVAAGSYKITNGGETGLLFISVEYTGATLATLATPSISYDSATGLVTITADVNASSTVYTTDGSDPKAADNENVATYTKPFTVADGTTVRVVSLGDETTYANSAEASKLVLLDITEVAIPTITSVYGTFNIACETTSTTLEYSLDGENFSAFTKPITVMEDATVYARATRGEIVSEVASATVAAVSKGGANNTVVLTYDKFDVEKVDGLSTLVGKDDALGYSITLNNSEKNWGKGGSINGYTTLMGSNGAQNTIYLPEGISATRITFFSYLPYTSGRISGWTEVGDLETQYADFLMGAWNTPGDPDVRTYPLTGSERSINFNNTGERPNYYIVLDVVDNKAELNATYDPAKISVIAGEEFEAPTLSITDKDGNDVTGLTVTYTSSNDDVATVDADGNIALVEGGVGEATITANVDGGESYSSAKASVKITVLAADAVLVVTENNTDVVLSQANIDEKGYLATSGAKWRTGESTFAGYTGIFMDMKTGRTITITEKGAVAFEVLVQNSTAGRTYTISVDGVNAATITHNGGGVESSGIIECSSDQISVKLEGSTNSVYPIAIKFYTEVPEEVAISSAEYTTYVTKSAVTIPSKINAYIVTKINEYSDGTSSVSLKQVTNVPANTPIIVNGKAGSYTLAAMEGDADDVSANKLLASDGSVNGGEGIYALAKMEEVGFYPVKEGVAVPAGKAYLNTSAAVKGFLALEGEVTAINNVEAASAHTSTIYNVAGQKVQNIKASGLYIVNGKKVFVK